MLNEFPAPDKELRLRFFMDVLAFASPSKHRLNAAHWVALRMLGKDYGIETAVVELEGSVSAKGQPALDNGLQGSDRRVAIYTLTESAGLRAKEMLERLFPGISVQLNGDHTCTDRLKALARIVDIFVFAWRSSKHQAFYCVKQARPKEFVTLLPVGKGSASIVRAVVEAAALAA